MRFTKTVLLIVLALLTSACDNNPYPASFSDKNIRLSAFSSRLKYLALYAYPVVCHRSAQATVF